MKWLNIATRKLMEDEWKKNLRLFLVTTALVFAVVVLALEGLHYLIRSGSNFGLRASTIRFRMQASLVDLYAEDIWRNGRRTLKTPFSTSICSVSHRKSLLFIWSEYQCQAVDKDGRKWIYTSRYGDNDSSAFLIPLIAGKEAAKELHIINEHE